MKQINCLTPASTTTEWIEWQGWCMYIISNHSKTTIFIDFHQAGIRLTTSRCVDCLHCTRCWIQGANITCNAFGYHYCGTSHYHFSIYYQLKISILGHGRNSDIRSDWSGHKHWKWIEQCWDWSEWMRACSGIWPEPEESVSQPNRGLGLFF